MWSIAISIVLVTLTGALVHFSEPGELAQRQVSGALQAESMAQYRGAVVRYFGVHREQRDTSVDLLTLRTEGALRDWSTLPSGRWDNYRTANGTIYVYGTEAPSADLAAALAKQSHHSLMAGTYHRASASLHSPSHGDTGIPLAPLLARRTLHDGVPVWLAGAP